MKISSLLFPPLLLLLLLLSGDDIGPSLVVNIVLGARIPEHTCHKLIEMKKCEIEKCNQRCSEFPNAVGEYSASYSHLSPKLKVLLSTEEKVNHNDKKLQEDHSMRFYSRVKINQIFLDGRALKRIFFLCDQDRDDALSDAEFNYFRWQRKELYKRSNEMESMAVVLPLKELRDECLPVPPKLAPNQSVELASEVVEFLCSIFGTYDKENDRAQSPIEHEDLFSTTPES
ncbi:hypothetical protein Pint_36362 [Pistacia integerrima]|uniref:Uncharacterized protein n=1 Tax=Pistacia integerrima TaxID=434235 RepID=A0ACC0Y2K6_9ROSI|nr:hypothetical protein Pint_36362 [Pistacia integerrima]